MTDDEEILEGFVEECGHCLDRFELDLAVLARDPGDDEAAADALRAVHTIAGTSGFLGLDRLVALARAGERLAGERLAGELHGGRRALDSDVTAALAALVGAARATLADLASGGDGEADHAPVISILEAAISVAPADRTEVVPCRH